MVETGRFLRFCVVGTIGFVADAGCTLLLNLVAGLAPLRARIAAFVIAATVTWALNRGFTFRSTAGVGSWAPYVLLTGLGALINIGIYWAWIAIIGTVPLAILAGVALGSIVALGFNFLVSSAIFQRSS